MAGDRSKFSAFVDLLSRGGAMDRATEDPVLLCLPAGHRVQDMEPGELWVPASQLTHCVLSLFT